MISASESRVTRSRRSLQRALLLLACGIAAATMLRAQEEPPTHAAGPETAPAADSAPPTVAPPTDASTADAPPTAPRPTGPSPSRFEPTEKVRADFDVSFPIDI